MVKISPEWVTGPEQDKSSGRVATLSLWTGLLTAYLKERNAPSPGPRSLISLESSTYSGVNIRVPSQRISTVQCNRSAIIVLRRTNTRM